MRQHLPHFLPEAGKKLRKIPRRDRRRIHDKIRDLQHALDTRDFSAIEIKKMPDISEKRWRLKIGDHYRLLYSLREEGSTTWIHILDVGPRENFY